MNQNNRKGLYICLAMLMLVVFLVMSWFNSTTTKKEAEYDLIIADFLEDRVGEYQLDFNTRTLTYTLWEDMPEPEEGGEASGEGTSQTPVGTILFPGARVPDTRVKTYQVQDSSLFISDVHDHVLEYNEDHPDRPVKVAYIGYSDPSFLTTWLPVLLRVLLPVIAIAALWWLNRIAAVRSQGQPRQE